MLGRGSPIVISLTYPDLGLGLGLMIFCRVSITDANRLHN